MTAFANAFSRFGTPGLTQQFGGTITHSTAGSIEAFLIGNISLAKDEENQDGTRQNRYRRIVGVKASDVSAAIGTFTIDGEPWPIVGIVSGDGVNVIYQCEKVAAFSREPRGYRNQ